MWLKRLTKMRESVTLARVGDRRLLRDKYVALTDHIHISWYRSQGVNFLVLIIQFLSFCWSFPNRRWVGGPSLETIYLWLSIRIIIFHYIKMELFLWLDNTRYMVSFLLKIPEFGSSFRKTDKYKREIQIILFNLFIKKDL